MSDLYQELGLKARPVNDDEVSEALWLRQMDRWGDLMICGRDADVQHGLETRYYFEPKVRRRLRYQAAVLRS